MAVGARSRSNGAVHSPIIARPKNVDRSPYLSFIFRAAAIADAAPVWSPHPYARDVVLRQFWKTEDMLKTAMFSMVSRYAAMQWSLQGPPLTREAGHDMLNNIEDGKGVPTWVSRVWLDVFTQDNGGVTQIIRSADDPEAPAISLKHLDSARCRRTGVYDTPFVYWDSQNAPHVLKWYQVEDFVDFPAPEDIAWGSGMCVVSRILEDARYVRDVAIFAHEKVAGRNPRAVHFVGGVSPRSLQKALQDHKLLSEKTGQNLYIDPPIIPGNDPTATVSKVTLEMASLYDGFDEDKAKRWFYVALSNAFGVDYQEFAPMPAGNLGTSQQSQTLSMKGNTKGPALFQAQMTHFMNYRGVLPNLITFNYYERDPVFEAAQLDLRVKRGQDRVSRLKEGELTPSMARQLAVRDGDLPQEFLSLADPPESIVAPDIFSTGPEGN